MARKRKRGENVALAMAASKTQARPISAIKSMPLASYRQLRDALDQVFSLFIRLRDKKRNNGLCLVCGKSPIQVCYHIIPRTELGTRWDPENAVGACSGCNYSELMNRRKRADHYLMWVQRLGTKQIGELERRSVLKTKYSLDELHNLLQYFKGKLSDGSL